MIGLVVATHSQLSAELINAAEMIIGPCRNACPVAILRHHGVEEIHVEIEEAIRTVSTDGDGVVIMTDMFGGTPSNVSLAFLDPGKVEVITGVNLPMVIKFFNSQDSLTLLELADLLKAYGQQSISLASEFLRQ